MYLPFISAMRNVTLTCSAAVDQCVYTRFTAISGWRNAAPNPLGCIQSTEYFSLFFQPSHNFWGLSWRLLTIWFESADLQQDNIRQKKNEEIKPQEIMFLPIYTIPCILYGCGTFFQSYNRLRWQPVCWSLEHVTYINNLNCYICHGWELFWVLRGWTSYLIICGVHASFFPEILFSAAQCSLTAVYESVTKDNLLIPVLFSSFCARTGWTLWQRCYSSVYEQGICPGWETVDDLMSLCFLQSVSF